MARAVAGAPHYVAQRGVNRQAVFFTDSDRVFISISSSKARSALT